MYDNTGKERWVKDMKTWINVTLGVALVVVSPKGQLCRSNGPKSDVEVTHWIRLLAIAYFSVVFATLCGLGDLESGLGNFVMVIQEANGIHDFRKQKHTTEKEIMMKKFWYWLQKNYFLRLIFIHKCYFTLFWRQFLPTLLAFLCREFCTKAIFERAVTQVVGNIL